MSSKLDILLENIDPSRTLDQVSAKLDQAVNSFAMRRATISNWDEYEQYLAEFFRHLESVVLQIGTGMPGDKDYYSARCFHLLNRAYGDSGYKAAFEMVRTGKEGGLYRILKKIGDLMTEEYAQNEISARVYDYWNSLTLDEMLAAPDEYISKYGHLLPSELIEGSAARIKANFPKVLEEHPKMIHRMRKIGK